MGKPLGPLIKQLQGKVEANLQALHAAEEEHAARERSERAATIASEHSAALHAVAEAILRPHRPAHAGAAEPPQSDGAGSPAQGPGIAAAAAGSADAPDAGEQCAQLLMPLHLAVPQLPPPPPAAVTGGVQLAWDPAGAVRLHAAPAPPDLSSDGFRAKLRRFMETSAFLLPRIQNAAPDADASADALRAARQELLEYFALMAVGRTAAEAAPATSGSPRPSGSSSSGSTLGSGSGAGADGRGGALSPMVEVVMSPLDGSAAPLPDRTHWSWAVEQMGLSGEQEALLSALLSAWHARRIAIAQRREALLARLGDAAPAAAAAAASAAATTCTSAATSCPAQPAAEVPAAAATTATGATAAPAGPQASVAPPAGGASAPAAAAAAAAAAGGPAAGPEGPVDLIKDLGAVQRAVEVNTAVYFLAIYGTALDAQHVAALALGSWPFVPSLHALHEIVCAPAARPAEGSSSGGESGGGAAAVDGPGRRATRRSRRRGL